MRYTGAPDISPRLDHRGKAVRRSYSAWRLAAADGTPPFWHGTGKPPSKASAQSKGKPLGARRTFWPLSVRMTPNGCCAMTLAPALNQMVPPPVDNPPPRLQVA